jgi:hypothetical protein
MELLTGVRFGELGAQGYAGDTVLGRAQRTLQAYRRACEGVEARKPMRGLRASHPHRPEPRRR